MLFGRRSQPVVDLSVDFFEGNPWQSEGIRLRPLFGLPLTEREEGLKRNPAAQAPD